MSDLSNAFFWFDSQAVSDAGHPRYGKYVFCHLLGYYSPSRGGMYGSRFVFDGDFLPASEMSIPTDGSAEQEQVRSAASEKHHGCYVVAVHSMGEPTLQEVDQALRRDNVVGYMGMTSCDGEFERFLRLAREMNLVPACNVRYGTFEKEDEAGGFSYLTDAELMELGYQEITWA